MQEETVQPHIESLIESRDYKALKTALGDMEVHDLAELIEDLPEDDRAVAFRFLRLDRATEVFEDLTHRPLEVGERGRQPALGGAHGGCPLDAQGVEPVGVVHEDSLTAGPASGAHPTRAGDLPRVAYRAAGVAS